MPDVLDVTSRDKKANAFRILLVGNVWRIVLVEFVHAESNRGNSGKSIIRLDRFHGNPAGYPTEGDAMQALWSMLNANDGDEAD